MFRIGEFARLNGLTVKTLRNYDLRGVFAPAWTDPASGYRYYSPAQMPDLRRILALRDLGLPLADVAQLVADGADLRAVLERRRQELENRRDEIAAQLAALDILVAGVGSNPDVVVRRVESQKVALLPTMPGHLEEAFYQLEVVVRDAGARAPLPPGTLIPQQGDGLEVFVPVTRIVDEGVVTSRRLPAERVATVIHRGSYQTMPETRQGLDSWLEASGHTQTGPTRILYLGFGAEPELNVPDAFLVDHSTDFVTEIQIPI